MRRYLCTTQDVNESALARSYRQIPESLEVLMKIAESRTGKGRQGRSVSRWEIAGEQKQCSSLGTRWLRDARLKII